MILICVCQGYFHYDCMVKRLLLFIHVYLGERIMQPDQPMRQCSPDRGSGPLTHSLPVFSICTVHPMTCVYQYFIVCQRTGTQLKKCEESMKFIVSIQHTHIFFSGGQVTEDDNYVFFFRTACTFSQFHPSVFTDKDGNKFTCMEQYMHYHKAGLYYILGRPTCFQNIKFTKQFCYN